VSFPFLLLCSQTSGPCLGGYDAVCVAGRISGYYTPGTFQQYVLAPANYVTPIPDALSSQDAAPQLCAGVTVYSALRKSGAESGSWVAILGAGGGLGHLAVQLASKGFALRVIGVDADAKKQLVLDSGAEHFVGLGSREAPNDTTAEVLKLTGGQGAQAVIVLTAANAAYATSVPMLKFGGRVVCIGIPEGDFAPIATAFPQVLVAKEQSIVGVAVGSRKDAIEVLDFAARRLVKVHSKVEKLENLTSVSAVCYLRINEEGM
jgi:propanol-preferring alcohol dehydrogenase